MNTTAGAGRSDPTTTVFKRVLRALSDLEALRTKDPESYDALLAWARRKLLTLQTPPPKRGPGAKVIPLFRRKGRDTW
jgi:hypothetical protein